MSTTLEAEAVLAWIAQAGDARLPGSREPPHPLLILFVMAVLWPFVTGFIAIFGGWRHLSWSFPSVPIVDGERYARQSVSLSLFGSYGSGVHVTLTEKGVHMAPMILFRLFHPPILVPWANVTACERCDFLFIQRTRIAVGRPADCKIVISGRVAPAIELAWRSRNTGVAMRPA
jgi:hypothetical protein